VAKLEVLNEQTCAVEGLLTADASKLLVDLVVELNVTLQARSALELVTTDAASKSMLLRPCDLMHGIVLECIKVLVTLMAVLVVVEVLFVVLHDLFGIERHVAVFVRTLDASDRL
jgi:hypothetical protein